MLLENDNLSLEEKVQRLIDIQEIMNVKGKYFRCLDAKDWDGLETTLSPNIQTSYSGGKLSFKGPKEVTNYFKGSMQQTMISMHMGHSPEIWFESPDVAYGHWYLQDQLIFTKPDKAAGYQIEGGAFYTDKYEKVDGQWLIAETGYVRIYEETFKRDDTHMITINMHAPKKPKKK